MNVYFRISLSLAVAPFYGGNEYWINADINNLLENVLFLFETFMVSPIHRRFHFVCLYQINFIPYCKNDTSNQ